jgi:hypothetical protein
MRKILLLLALLVLSISLRAQGVGGGIQVAGVASQIDGDQWGGYNKLGIGFGGFAFYDFNDYLALQIELLYGHRGSREVTRAYGQINLNLIDMPILLRLRCYEWGTAKFYAEAGPSVNTLLSARNGFKDLKYDVTDFYHRFNLEVHLGASLMVQDRVGMFLRWSYGLTNLNVFTRPWFAIHYISLGGRLSFK